MSYPHLRRVLLLFFCTALSTVLNHSYGQQTPAIKGTPIQEALKKINHVYGTHFLYDEDLLKGKSTGYDMTTIKNKSLEEVLKGILYPHGLVFLYIKPNYYTIVPKERVGNQQITTAPGGETPSLQLELRERIAAINGWTISGTVTDKKGNPLEQTTVSSRETNAATVCDPNGHFSINIAATKGSRLTFSCIGYEPREVTVKSDSVVNIVLLETSARLQEVVVIGYGTQKKEDITGSVATVGSKELNENHSSTAVSDMLAGRVTGLYVQKSDGTVGTGSDLKVRGLSTFNNSNPLIVIDGIPDRNIDDLNPTDIEAISVLKDAASIAVYGARAANGVILVSTRKGRTGRPEITFSANAIQQTPTSIYKRLNSYQYASTQNEALQNENSLNPALGMGYSDEQLQKYKDGSDPDHYPNTDWIKTLTKPHLWQSSYNLSASGGSENVKYFLSAGYVHNGGYVPVEYYKRWNLRSNVEANITRYLKVNLNLGGVFGTTNGEGVYGMDYVFGEAYATPPTRPNQFSNGYYAYVPEQRGNAYLQSTGKTGFNTNYNNTLNSTLSLQYDLPWLKGFYLLGTAAYDKGYGYGKQFALPFDQYTIDDNGNYTQIPPYPTAPYLRESFTQSTSLTLEGSLNYKADFDNHHLAGLLLYTQTQVNTDNFNTERDNFVSGALPQLSLGDPTRVSNAGTGTQSARQGVVGRLSYDYASRYLLEFSFRDDGSDIFPPGHRFGFFPSVSGGWILSNEPFFKEPVPGLDFLKLRGSWGQLGNDRVNPYQFLSTYSLVGSNIGGGYTFGGPNPTFYQSLQPGVLPNPSFTWERAIMTNIGLEAHYKKDLLTLEMDYFRKRTKDILAPPALQAPSVIGAALPDYNNAIVDNNGLEIHLGHANHIGKVAYFIDVNASFNHNKIVSYPESRSTPAWQKITGGPVSNIQIYSGMAYPYLGYHAQGLYQTAQEVSSGPTPLYPTAAPGDIRYQDIDKDGAITANDQQMIGRKFFPGMQYGIRWGVRYQGLELNVLLQGSANVQGYNDATIYGKVAGSDQILDHWTPQNTGAPYPRLWSNYQNNAQTSDYWIVNTAYMRIKNMELAYNLPRKMLQKTGIKNLRISFTGNNLATFTHFKWYDPETITGSSTYQVGNPLMRSFTGGIALQF